MTATNFNGSLAKQTDGTRRTFAKRIQRMALILVVTQLTAVASTSFASEPQIVLKHLKGGVYLVEDFYYVKENSAVYVGPETVTVIGATWTPESAERLVAEVRKVTPKPINEVIVPDYHPREGAPTLGALARVSFRPG